MVARFGELSDLYTYGAPSVAFGSLTDEQRIAGIEAASAEAEGFFRSRGQLPLLAWTTDLTMKVMQIAAYELMCRVGFNPAAGSDQNYLIRSNSAREWLKMVARGEANPGVTYSTTYAVRSQPHVRSRARRGWPC